MSKYSRYFVIEKQMKGLGFHPDRIELIDSFTEGKESSLTGLSETEYREFCIWITQSFIPENKKSWQDTPENRMRRKIIGIFKEMGYTHSDGKADMEAINKWCRKYGFAKKKLNNHSREELTKLIHQAEKVKLSFIKSVTK